MAKDRTEKLTLGQFLRVLKSWAEGFDEFEHDNLRQGATPRIQSELEWAKDFNSYIGPMYEQGGVDVVYSESMEVEEDDDDRDQFDKENK